MIFFPVFCWSSYVLKFFDMVFWFFVVCFCCFFLFGVFCFVLVFWWLEVLIFIFFLLLSSLFALKLLFSINSGDNVGCSYKYFAKFSYFLKPHIHKIWGQLQCPKHRNNLTSAAVVNAKSNSEICIKFSILMTLVSWRMSKQNYSPILSIVTNRSLFLINKDVL